MFAADNRLFLHVLTLQTISTSVLVALRPCQGFMLLALHIEGHRSVEEPLQRSVCFSGPLLLWLHSINVPIDVHDYNA